jgi:predicted acylesterase/phospholipase RssA
MTTTSYVSDPGSLGKTFGRLIPSKGPETVGRDNGSLGGKDKTLRIYTFSGGGFDSAMQLGVVHALLTADYDWPDLVSGVSAGAISAVALAEILQAGGGLAPAAQHAAQVAKFRIVLEAYREGPLQLLMAQFPDGYETNARQATENLQLPIHLEAERDGRKQAQRAESGLIRLINELLAIDLPMRQAVLLVRIALAIREGWEVGAGRLTILGEFALLYGYIVRNLRHLALPVGRIVFVLLKANDDPPAPCPARDVLFRRQPLKRRWGDFIRMLVGGLVLVAAPALYVIGRVAGGIRKKMSLSSKVWWKGPLQFCLPKTWWKRFFSRDAKEECLKAVFAHYALAKDIGDSNALQQLFVEVFDPDYFGTLDMTEVTAAALRREKEGPPPQTRNPRTLHHYASQDQRRPVRVAILAADIDKFRVRPVPEETAVVDALLAATAIVPIFRAVGLPVFKDNDVLPPKGTVFYIDGENVNADPLRPTIKFLQKEINVETKAVRFYSSVAFPISKLELATNKQYRGLVDVAMRSMQLQHLQNALLERNLIDLYYEALKSVVEPDRAVLDRTAADGNRRGKHKPLIAARVISIEAEEPLRLNYKIPGARSQVERRALIDQAVADGCRATLTAWLADADEPLHETGVQLRNKNLNAKRISCGKLMRAHFERLNPGASRPERPESRAALGAGPGLCEVCDSCSFFRDLSQPNGSEKSEEPGFDLPAADQVNARAFVEIVTKEQDPSPQIRIEPKEEPTVSLLFSGGVFRGVYQIGVANALQVLELRPNIVAGASVGSITAALVAEIFSRPQPAERHKQMCLLASTYLALDRLILTDRFYDFVRRITLRAGGADFSPKDLDMLFRRYDEDPPEVYSGKTRRTIAGLERLLYLSPFELLELVEAHRHQNYSGLYSLIGRHLQELLDRNGASLEILGAEPLVLLLTEHLLRYHKQPVPRFNLFADKGSDRNIHLLATVTNLTKGKLRTLGSPHRDHTEWPILREGLLASSAFPGVFRPRNSWEIFPTSADQDQYVDGGVMDNLPLDSVVRFLDDSAAQRTGGESDLYIRRRPGAPHLLVTGSLEPNCHPLGRQRTDQVRRCWISLYKRARQIKYNRKIHDFEVAQRDMREIWSNSNRKPGSFEPLDIEVVTVKPEWLCGTFAFHPMLGFSRRRQAASIAHGCAGTLRKMRDLSLRSPVRVGGTDFWGMRRGLAKIVTDKVEKNGPPGTCWFCSELICPFSETALNKLDQQLPEAKLPKTTRQSLASIYHECGKCETHPEPPAVSKNSTNDTLE